MKTFQELTHEEILALTDEEIDRYIDLECARAGVPLLPPEPGPKPEKPEASKDVTLYEVSGLYFREHEQANRVVEAILEENPVRREYAPGPGYTQVVSGPLESLSATADKHYSLARWNEVKDDVARYEEKKRAWDEINTEYRDALGKREEASTWIWGRINEERETERKRERFADLLSRYVDLAEGDEAVARKFLLQAHPEAEEHLPKGQDQPAQEEE